MFTNEDAAAARAAFGTLARAWGLGDPIIQSMTEEDDSIVMGGWVIQEQIAEDGPRFEVTTEVIIPSCSRWEPDDHDYEIVGVFKTLDEALAGIASACVSNALQGFRQAAAEAKAAADDAQFWAEQAEYVRKMINDSKVEM